MIMGGGNSSRAFVCLIGMPLLFIFFLPKPCLASIRNYGKLDLGFNGNQMKWIDNDGLFLLSNNSIFGFGFETTTDVTKFLIVIVHMGTSQTVWAANRGSPVGNSDDFVFGDDGNAYLQSGNNVVWSTNTSRTGVSAMELLDSGNLILVGSDGGVVWQSFDHPTDTLLSNQRFSQGMKLMSDFDSSKNVSFSLEINSGDMILSADFSSSSQPYWSMGSDQRSIINKDGGPVNYASIEAGSWKLYDANGVFLSQFAFAGGKDSNVTWAAVLGSNGYINFKALNGQGSSNAQIPDDGCSRLVACGPYHICQNGNTCQCPIALSSQPSCQPKIDSSSCSSTQLISLGEGLSYPAIEFVTPSSKDMDLDGCKNSCKSKCSCLALFFDNKTGNCFLFDQIGSLQQSANGASFESYVKVLSNGGNPSASKKKGFPYAVIVIVVVALLVIFGLVYFGIRYYKKKNSRLVQTQEDETSEDNFLESISGMPVRFGFKDLQDATNNFAQKLGQGGFGSVYQGVLKDGTRLAVKQLEGIGQGKKEFRAEVSIIGSIHHHHLVRLKGFCTEGKHRLLVYEYMANGSLDRWIFRKDNGEFMLDWDTRYNIAVGTAKGLAYLHEDCDVKIVHCDIKPENVLLDDHFLAKVSDFGLAKLMTREQSHVFTTLRGTRGYLAPEWITNYAISEKSDVYSYGMVLLEIIGGRKSYDASEISEKAHFPSYAFKMMEEGKLGEILDPNLKTEVNDERVAIAIRVALWCIQDDMNLRPPMTKVVQMLEGLYHVPQPPLASQTGSRLYSGLFKSISEEGTTSSGPSDCNSDAYLSAVRLSGPR